MTFQEFVEKLHHAIGGASSKARFTKSLFENIIIEGDTEFLKMSPETYKSYANGNTKITKIAKTLLSHIEQENFINYLSEINDGVAENLCATFKSEIPDIDMQNFPQKITDLFVNILNDAANKKRKSTPKGAKTDLTHNTQIDDQTTYSEEYLFNTFKNECDSLLQYCIKNDPTAVPTLMSILDDIEALLNNWEFNIRKINNQTNRLLIEDTLQTLSSYSYYLSDKFLKPIDEDRLFIKNSSFEEGELLRNVLRPKSYELRCKLANLYKKLWPAPELDQANDNDLYTEIIDDNKTIHNDSYQNITIIQNQTNIEHDESKTYNITNSTVTFNV